jgi:hypothetical protein
MSTPVTAYNPIPSSYDASRQRTQWVETMGTTSLPSGKVWINPTGEYTVSECQSHGVTHFSKYDLVHMDSGTQNTLKTTGKSYDAVPRPEAFFNLTRNNSMPASGIDQYGFQYPPQWYPTGPLTQAQAEQKADAMGLDHAIWIGETQEGDSWIGPGHPMWKWFHNRFRTRMETKWGGLGIPFFIAHNYFHFKHFDWADLGVKSRSEQKAKFARPVDQWEGNDFSAGGSLARTNTICEGIYLPAPDVVRKGVLGHIFKILVNKKMGYYTCTFLFSQHEWRPNNWQSISYSEEFYPADGEWGTFLRTDKIAMDPNDIMSYALWGLEFGDIYVEWGAAGKITTDDLGYGWQAEDLWYPEDSLTPNAQAPEPGGGSSTIAVGFPHYSVPGGPSKGWRYNWSAFGVRMYGETFGKVTGSGSTAGFCEYRIDGGAWVTPQASEADEIIDSYYDSRAFVRWRRKSGKIAIGYFNQAAVNTKQTLEVKHPTTPGVIYSMTICGSATHAVLITE